MRRSAAPLALALGLLAQPAALAGAGGYFLPLGDLPGGLFYSEAFGVSPDGTVVVGRSQGSGGEVPFRSVIGQTMQSLSAPPGGALGASLGGSVVVGYGNSANGVEAFRWTQQSGVVGLGDLPGNIFESIATDVTPDGEIIVGSGASAAGREAIRWTQTSGMVGLGDLPGGSTNSRAEAISANGAIVVGRGASASGTEAFVWREGLGMIGLGDLPGGSFFSAANAVSADGTTVVGGSDSGGGAAGASAFLWTESSGMIALGPTGYAYGVSGDGSVVIGSTGLDAFGDAFIWDEAHGARNLKTVLQTEFGLNLTGWTLRHAYGITPDGLTICGVGIDPQGRRQAWVAGIPEPSTLAGGLLGLLFVVRRRS